MRTQKYKVSLTEVEACMLQKIIDNEKPIKQIVKRAKILLELDRLNYQPIPNKFCPQEIVANCCGVSTSLVYQTSKKFVEKGIEAPGFDTLNQKKGANKGKHQEEKYKLSLQT